jgi:hypothetical protein
MSKLKHNSISYFYFQITLLLAVVVIFDFIAGETLRYFYFRQGSGEQSRTTYAIEKATEEIIIFGSSRAYSHYNPAIFESHLKLSSYNFGRIGYFIPYHYAVLKALLARVKPKIVILDLTNNEFEKKQEDFEKLSALLPYYKTHPEIRPVIELKSPYEKLKLFSKSYPFNSLILSIIAGNTDFHRDRDIHLKGHAPWRKNLEEPLKIVNTSKKYTLDPVKIELFESFIRECQRTDIRLFIICSPYFIKFTHKDPSVHLGEEIARKHQVDFWDYSQNPLFLGTQSFFADPRHLNEEGSRIYSEIIAKNIRGRLGSVL